MSIPFGSSPNFNQFQAIGLVLENLGTAPSSPAEGRIYDDTALHSVRAFLNGSWISFSGGLANAFATVSDGTTNISSTGADAIYFFPATTALSVTATVTDASHGNHHTIVIGFNSANVALSSLGVPTANVSWGNFNITSLADPVNPQDAANKRYVDTTIQGLSQKPTARLATAAALPTNTYANGTAGVGATLTATTNAALTVDGIAVAVGDIVLVKNEVATANNGLYTVTQAGDGTHPYILTRQIDMDQSAEFPGAFVIVDSEGTANKNSLWLVNAFSGAVTVGTTAVTFTQLNAATSLIAGSGINITGNIISVSGYTGAASIVTVGTLTSGSLGSGFTAVAVAQGGSGQTSAANARGGSGLGASTAPATGSGGIVASLRGIPVMVTGTITHDGATTAFTVTHNIGNADVASEIRDAGQNKYLVDTLNVDSNNTRFTWAAAQPNTTVFHFTIWG